MAISAEHLWICLVRCHTMEIDLENYIKMQVEADTKYNLGC